MLSLLNYYYYYFPLLHVVNDLSSSVMECFQKSVLKFHPSSKISSFFYQSDTNVTAKAHVIKQVQDPSPQAAVQSQSFGRSSVVA